MDKNSETLLEKTDLDSHERYDIRRQWYPHREHRTDKNGGPIDCMGDESFYRPSLLGKSYAEPNHIIAGEKSPLKLRYYGGKEKLAEGTTVRFYMRGQAPLGINYTLDGDEPNGRITISSSCHHCEIEPLNLGFRVKKGSLMEGDMVEILIGPDDGFNWTKIAGKYEFKVVLRYGEWEGERRLPEPLVINVHPRGLHRLEGTLPCTNGRFDEMRLHITARDEFDNRIESNDIIFVKSGLEAKPVRLVRGVADCNIKVQKDDSGRSLVQRIKIIHRENNLDVMTNPCISADDYELFIGDLHIHDFLSEAHEYTDKVYRWAIEDRNLDFMSLSIQTHGWIDNEKWAIVKYMNERYLDEGRFVTLLANEWQHTAFGDKIVHYLGGDHPYISVDDIRYNSAGKVYEALRECDALVISHHSSYPKGSWCSSTDFNAVETDVERLTELWSMHGSSEGFDLDDRPLKDMDGNNTVMNALRNGLRLGFVAGSDTHSGRPGGSIKEPRPYWGGLAAVWAKSLTRRDIFNALYERRTYALTGARIILKMTVNGALMGSEIPPSEVVDIKIDIWGEGRISKVQVIKNTYLHKEFMLGKDECHIQLLDKTQGAAFYYCRVVQQDGHLAVCSPIWVG